MWCLEAMFGYGLVCWDLTVTPGNTKVYEETTGWT